MASVTDKKTYTRADVALHKEPDDLWIILHGRVYNVTKWAETHPGGKQVLRNYGGEDASVAWETFHNNKKFVRGHMGQFYIGDIVEEEKELKEIEKDFLRLKEDMIKKGYFRPNPLFFILSIIHVILIEAFGVFILYYFGVGWIPWIISAFVLSMAQLQAGWTQHDYGHRSVFNSTTLNRIFQDFTTTFLKGSMASWWNGRHFPHHSKPNDNDPDTPFPFPFTFMLGTKIPAEWGKNHWGRWIPFHRQHQYFFLTLPPFCLPVIFHVEQIHFAFTKASWMDRFLVMTFIIRWYCLFAPFLGFWGGVKLYFFMRFIESHFFIWITQFPHISMEFDMEEYKDFPSSLVAATTSVTSNWFLDWLTGHLNHHIEHHFFPTMPRHNYPKVRGYVQEFCKKHDLKYSLKTMWSSCADIIRALKKSADIYQEAWEMSSIKQD